MRVGERILLAFSRPVDAPDLADAAAEPGVEHALDDLLRRFPDLPGRVRGRRVLDFGCGAGRQAVALARAGAAFVLGVESNPRTLAGARALAAAEGIPPDRLALAPGVPEELRGGFDVVLSKDSMEHFADPAAVLALMRDALAPGGRLLVTFGPPWLAPSGSHMHFFTPLPWVHLLFAERTVMAVRARYRADGARRYEEVESGLNRMTVGRFERLAARAGLRMERRRYDCVKGIRVLGGAPLLRELFINNVACVLAPSAPVVPRRHT
ncbi:MAG TPA: methyltransferase domain-containing protein [Longimicrobium sp.]|nr:methyltransferase domain-containing protein [Longimicrobium sp.]